MPRPLRDDQALFVRKIVLPQHAIRPGGAQLQIALRPKAPPRDAGKQKQLVVQAAVAVQQADAGQLQDGFVDADVARAVVKVLPGAALHIDLGFGGQRGRPQQPARVVVVAVAEHDGIHPAQVQPQRGGVGGKGVRRAGVQQQGVARGLDIQAQTVLMGAARCAGGVFDQGDDAHGSPLSARRFAVFSALVSACPLGFTRSVFPSIAQTAAKRKAAPARPGGKGGQHKSGAAERCAACLRGTVPDQPVTVTLVMWGLTPSYQ